MAKYEPKMKINDQSIIEFIEAIDSEKKRIDAYKLLEIYEEVSGYEPKMWGPSIIGFGSYHYKYASGHEGDAPLAAFSPRKAKISLYFSANEPNREQLLSRFGKHTASKGCVYINKLADVDEEVLKELIEHSIQHTQKMYPTT